MIDRTNVQVLIFAKNPKVKFLILKRTPERSGYWQPVCGGVEQGEKLEDTVKREVFEETGIRNIKSIIDLNYTFKYCEPKNGKQMMMQDYCFAVEIEEVVDIRISDEHERYVWCTYEEAMNYLKWEHNIIALKKLVNKLNL